ncbi:patatin-like phospholipase family protein [Candidatus Neptunochlamydia vexilliferae]|nr:patatin-like phospholipase family protein [Candidatus Neptunochlamydia vexilliferae]
MGYVLFILTLFCVGCTSLKLSQAKPEPIPQFQGVKKPVKVALVLGGGGSKGIAHIGVLQELEQAGIHPDLIIGCSSGAIIGSLYADHPSVVRLEELLIDLKRSDLMDISFSRFGLTKGTMLETFLEKHLEAFQFHQLKIPFIAVAADLATGELIELGRGPIIPAIHASSAAPGVFNPVYYLGRYLVDGGVVNPIPVNIAKKYGAEVVIAVDIGEELTKKDPSNLFAIAERSLYIGLVHLFAL